MNDSTITINGQVKEISELSEVWGKIVQPIRLLNSIDANNLETANPAMQAMLSSNSFKANDWCDEFSNSLWIYESVDGNSVEVAISVDFEERSLELTIDSMSGSVVIDPIHVSRTF